MYASGFVPGTGMVSFEGTSPQTITTSNPENFYRLKINNPAGVTLSGSAEVAGWLYLTNGRINTTDAEFAYHYKYFGQSGYRRQ